MTMHSRPQGRPGGSYRPPGVQHQNQQRQHQQNQQQQQQQQNQQQQPQQQNNRYIPNGQPNRATAALKGQQQRITIDYYGSTLRGLEMQSSGAPVSIKGLPVDPSYTVDVLPPAFVSDEPDTSFATRFVYRAENIIKSPVNVARWTPEGRWLMTGSSHGEFTPWTGLNFKFGTTLTAHDTAIHAMKWSHDSQWLISSDHEGVIKYWQPNLNNLKAFQGHKYPVRDLRMCSFSPSDLKFVSASDDHQLKIWDFRRLKEDMQLSGHNWDVRTVDWHPHLGMIASGSRDKTIRVWDPRSTKCLATIKNHGDMVTQVQWNQNGRWLLSSGRDCCIKLFDVRKLNEEVTTFVTKRQVHSIAWHPVHETMFASGGSLVDKNKMQSEGSIEFWVTDSTRPKACVEGAHESQIWSMDWHPTGHILATSSNDKTTKLWCRPRPGEHLPTELGGLDVDERIFSDPVNHDAAEQMASHGKEAKPAISAELKFSTAKNAAQQSPLSNEPKTSSAADDTHRPPTSSTSLQSANVGQAKITFTI
ncbi:WD repeat-containing protein 33 [Coemansia sp. RSA 1807]|nr:WD repeat-containing protein 33 [Coemansia sp. RSA 1807]